jgi:hypothetical protein
MPHQFPQRMPFGQKGGNALDRIGRGREWGSALLSVLRASTLPRKVVSATLPNAGSRDLLDKGGVRALVPRVGWPPQASHTAKVWGAWRETKPLCPRGLTSNIAKFPKGYPPPAYLRVFPKGPVPPGHGKTPGVFLRPASPSPT